MDSEIATVKPFESWQDALSFMRTLGFRFAFRGQANSNWGLETTLERGCTSTGPARTEPLLIKAFKSRAHQYGIPTPSDENNLEWLALMQHHGVPTRLLDWTKSPYVAAYFAAEPQREGTSDFSIWAVDLLWLRGEASKKLKQPIAPPVASEDEFAKRFLSNITSFVAPVQAQKMNERIASQQGLFLCMGNANRPFELNLMEMPDLRTHLFKLNIRDSLRYEVLYELDVMNINRGTLFPGLDGFSRSLALRATVLRQRIGNLQQELEVDAILGEFGFL